MKLVIATVLALAYLASPSYGADQKPKPVVTEPQPKPTPWVCDYPVFRCGIHSGG